MNLGHSDAKPSRLWLVVRIAGAVVILIGLTWVVLRSPSAVHLLRSPIPLVLSFACGLTAMLAFALRMRACLGFAGVRMKARSMVDIHFRSMLFFFILPASIGQDASRAALIAGAMNDTKEKGLGDRIRIIGGSILIDRIVGVSTLLSLGLLALPHSLLLETARQYPLALWGGVCLLAIIGAAGGIKLMHARSRSSLPDQSWQLTTVAPAVFFSLLGQCLIIMSVTILIEAAKINVSYSDVAVVSAVSTFGQLIPLGLFGLNSGDAAAFSLYLSLGLPPEDAALPVLALYTQHVAAAVVGGIREISSGISRWHSESLSP